MSNPCLSCSWNPICGKSPTILVSQCALVKSAVFDVLSPPVDLQFLPETPPVVRPSTGPTVPRNWGKPFGPRRQILSSEWVWWESIGFSSDFDGSEWDLTGFEMVLKVGLTVNCEFVFFCLGIGCSNPINGNLMVGGGGNPSCSPPKLAASRPRRAT